MDQRLPKTLAFQQAFIKASKTSQRPFTSAGIDHQILGLSARGIALKTTFTKNHGHFEACTTLPASPEDVFNYHARPGAIQRLIPPWENVTVVRQGASLEPGTEVLLSTRIAGIPQRWLARHTELEPPRKFVDIQASGPFSQWQHEHRFEPVTESNTECRLVDSIQYRLPLSPLSDLIAGRWVTRELERMFAYRHRVTAADLTLASRYPIPSQTIGISGSSGLVGRNLCAFLGLMGHRVIRLVRGMNLDTRGDDPNAQNPKPIAAWGLPTEANRLSELDTVIHIAGESIAGGRWTVGKKERIRDSRVNLTRQLCERMAGLAKRPSTLLCASAIGFYGDRGDEELIETSSAGKGFLPSVAREWEEACQPAVEAGIRVVHLRFGVILSPAGGALKSMLLPAKLCGGRLGSGKQWLSWIAMDDVLGLTSHLLANPSISGAVNVVSPTPVRNKDFAAVLGRVLRRPPIFPAPASALRLALGEMAGPLLLASTRVLPHRAVESGFEFQYPQLEEALRHLLGR